LGASRSLRRVTGLFADIPLGGVVPLSDIRQVSTTIRSSPRFSCRFHLVWYFGQGLAPQALSVSVLAATIHNEPLIFHSRKNCQTLRVQFGRQCAAPFRFSKTHQKQSRKFAQRFFCAAWLKPLKLLQKANVLSGLCQNARWFSAIYRQGSWRNFFLGEFITHRFRQAAGCDYFATTAK